MGKLKHTLYTKILYFVYYLYYKVDKDYIILNGADLNEYIWLINIYKDLVNFIKDGYYINLGCGTGLQDFILKKFFGKNIKIYGIDINCISIYLANKLHKKYSLDNKVEYICMDYYDLYKNKNFFINKDKILFDTILFNTLKIKMIEEEKFLKLVDFLFYFLKDNGNFIIFNDDGEAIKILREFKINKLYNLKYVNKNFIVLNK